MAAVVALVLAGAAVAVVTQIGGSSTQVGQSPRDYTTKYGTIPAWIPHAIPQKNPAAPVATLAKPRQTEPAGQAVHAVLPLGMTIVTGAGPGTSANAAQSPAAGSGAPVPVWFQVTFSSTQGDVPLRAGAFSIATEQGSLVHPEVSMPGSHGSLPRSLPVGKTVTLTLRASLPTGEGQLRWVPQGAKVFVGWIYTFDVD